MQSFKVHTNEAQALKFYNLLPKKIRHTINRLRNRDKYKAALLMIKHLRKDPDVISRGLTKARIQGIAADHFGLNHREFSKILNRQTRYEVKDYNIGKEIGNLEEAYSIQYTSKDDIKHIPYSAAQLKDIDKLYTKTIKLHSTPLIFDTSSSVSKKGIPDGKIKVQTAIFKNIKPADYPSLVGPSGYADWSTGELKDEFKSSLLIKGTGSGSDKKAEVLKMFGIKTNTDFLEFFQAIGLFIPNKLTPSKFKDQLLDMEGTISGDFSINSFVPNKWKEFVTYLDADKEIGADVISLVNGSYFWRKDAGVTKPYVIWDGIKKYYGLMRNKEGITGIIKDNTADCVLIDGTYAELVKALGSDIQIDMDDDTGKLTCGDVSWYQISLKLGEGSARLGKITKLLTGAYPVDGEVQNTLTRAGIDPKWFKEDVELNNEFEQLLQEGFFGDTVGRMKKAGTEMFNKFKVAAMAILKYWKKLQGFMKKLVKFHERNTMKEIQKITRGSKFLKEEVLEEDILNEMSQAAMFNAIVNDKGRPQKQFTNLLNTRFNDIIKNKDSEYISVNFEKAAFEISDETINFLIGNAISFPIIQAIINDVKSNGIDVVNNLVKTMSMGDTNLPVVKVYGNPSKADTEVITVGKLTQTNPMLGDKQIKVLKVGIVPHRKHKKYWVINCWIFAELDGEVAKYHQVAFKKSGESSFNFNIEGTATVPENKIKLFPVS